MLHLQASCNVEADGDVLPSGHGWQSVLPSSLKKFCGHLAQDTPDPFLRKRAKYRSTTEYTAENTGERMTFEHTRNVGKHGLHQVQGVVQQRSKRWCKTRMSALSEVDFR